MFAATVRQHLDAGAPVMPLMETRFRAPIACPGKIMGVGRNYADHAMETGVQPFENPRITSKMPSAVADPGSSVLKSEDVHKLDFDAELGVVIGALAKNVDEVDALDYVAGYVALNDISAREYPLDVTPAQTIFARSHDGFCPLGPWIATSDEIGDPQRLRVRCLVNGQVMQNADTADMLFLVRRLIAYISRFMTLEPGDVIATGTPAGISAFRQPPQWLQPGDRIEVRVTGLGSLVTTIFS